MNFLKALSVAVLTYIGIVLAVILAPVVFLLFLWTGFCVLAAVFMLFFWLLITHSVHTLYMSLYLLALGAPAFLAAGVLGYYHGQRRARQRVPLVTLGHDAPFQ
jgi:hypothetical protein